MTDVKPSANPLFLREEDLRQGMELLFYAYRDFTAEPEPDRIDLLTHYACSSRSRTTIVRLLAVPDFSMMLTINVSYSRHHQARRRCLGVRR